LSSKLKTISQNKEYDANKMIQEESKIAHGIVSPKALSNGQQKEWGIKRRKIFIKGRQIGIVNFHKAAMKCNLKLPNLFLGNQIIDITIIQKEEEKIASPVANVSGLINTSNQMLNSDSSPAVKPVVSKTMDIISKNFSNETPAQKVEMKEEYPDDDPMKKWMETNKAREDEIQQKLNKNYDEEEGPPLQMIRYLDVWMYFLTEDYSEVIDDIVRESGNSGGLMSMFKSKSTLDKSLQEDRDIFICLAKIGLDTSIEVHERILNSIYMHLTGKSSWSRTGQHWIDVGFQNPDPYTDIRGSGILGLIQLLYFVELYNEIAWRYVAHSQNPEYKFPFIIKWFEFTTLTLKMLRSGKLFKTWNQKRGVDGVWNELYSASIWLFMSKYIQQQANIRHMNDLNAQVFDYVEKNPDKVVQQFHAYLESLRDKEESIQGINFHQYEISQNSDKEESDEEDEPYTFGQNAGRLSKYTM
jgi:ELMO domain-containing protein